MWCSRAARWFAVLGVAGPACFYDPSGSEPMDAASTTTTGGSAEPGATTETTGAETTTGAGPTTDAASETSTGATTDGSSTGGATEALTGESTGESTGETTATSTGASEICGDMIVDPGEACDDGNGDDHDECTNKCEHAVCGDGVPGPGEACDDGDGVDDDECTNACELPSCGDGFKQPAEDCDDAGESADCDANCTIVECGDGTFNASAEVCDDGGPTLACDADCTAPACHDGSVNPAVGEECEDDDMDPGDACSPDCKDTKVVQIALGASHTCVRFAGGGVRCWGGGSNGALGHGDNVTLGEQPGDLPTANLALGGAATDLTAGDRFTCAVVDGTARCWGEANAGKLGYGDLMHQGDGPGEMPTAPLALGPGAVVQIDSGTAHTCAILVNKTTRCWGDGESGKLGSGGTTDVGDGAGEMPPAALQGIDQARQIAAGPAHTCLLQQDDSVRCWGANNYGQLGIGSTAQIGDGPGEIPPALALVGGPVAQVAVGAAYTCARLKSGAVRCWGQGSNYVLGTGSLANVGDQANEVPTDVPLGGPALHVGAGDSHACALMMDGAVKCWGNGQGGRLGYGNQNSVSNPAAIPAGGVELGGPAVLLAVGNSHTCALLADDTLRCWGYNFYGQLGYGSTQNVGDNEAPAAMGPVLF